MIIHERLNLTESIQFLICMRRAVAEAVCKSNQLSDIQRVNLRNFVLKEASDYEIMSLALNGELPDKKYDSNAELRLFSNLKEAIYVDYKELSEALDVDVLQTIISEIGPIHPITSTALPVLEHYLSEEPMSDDEGDPEKVRKATSAIKNFVKDAGEALDKGTAKAADKANELGAKAKAAMADPEFRKDLQNWMKEKGADAQAALKHFKDKLQGYHAKSQDYGARHPEARPKTDLKGDVEHAVGKAVEKGKEIAGKAVEKGKEAVGAAKKLAKDHDVEGKVARGAEAVASKAKGAYNQAKELAGKPAGETIAKGVEKAHQAYEKGKEYAGTTGGAALAATALAGMAAYGASKIYKRFFSQAARACSGKSGAQKTACMQQFKVKAAQAKVQSLVRSKATCKKAKNPQKCMAAIDAEIQKAKAKSGK
jgi:hypothetical protein